MLWKLAAEAIAQEMKLSEITLQALRALGEGKRARQEIGSLHRRCHQLWGLLKRGAQVNKEDVVNAHAILVRRMKELGLNHNMVDDLDRISKRFEAISLPDLDGLPERILVTEDFVSIVGSVAQGGQGHDLDVLIRAVLDGRDFRIQAENVHLPLRKALDPEKRGYLHFIANPSGPHADCIPLYDLMLVRKSQIKVRRVGEADGEYKADSEYKVDSEDEARVSDEELVRRWAELAFSPGRHSEQKQ